MNRKWRKYPGTDGVSEAIGFLLIFSMVIVGIGLVTLYGYPMLLQQQNSADERIMEKNMIVLQNDVKSLSYKMVPYKETSLKIGGGSLTAKNPVGTSSPTFNVYDEWPICNFYGSKDVGTPANFQSGAMDYYSPASHTEISLQNGAVVMRDLGQSGSSMLAEPRWFIDEETNTIVINLIVINTSEPVGRSGIGTVRMKLQNVTFYQPYEIDAGRDIYVSYSPPASGDQDYSTAWNNYFVNTMGMVEEGSSDCGTAGTEFRFNKYIDNSRKVILVIKKYDIAIQGM